MSDKLRPDNVRERVTAGKLDRRVTIRRASYSQDSGSGEMLETWSNLAEAWASWRRASARETLAAAEVSAEVTDVFTMRWSPVLASVTPKDRVLYQGREYNVSEVAEVGRREGIMIRGAARAE
jgi:SPP1 family predicted phage head-tail adaptor